MYPEIKLHTCCKSKQVLKSLTHPFYNNINKGRRRRNKKIVEAKNTLYIHMIEHNISLFTPSNIKGHIKYIIKGKILPSCLSRWYDKYFKIFS